MGKKYRIFKTETEDGKKYFFIKEKILFLWFDLKERKRNYHLSGYDEYGVLKTFETEQEAIDHIKEMNKPVFVFKPEVELIREITI